MEYEREESMGYILPEQGLFQMGQTLLKAGVQVAAQGAFQGYEKQAGGLMAAWGKDFIGEATVNVLQQVATNATNGFIDANSLEIEDGQVVGWRFDGDQWAESVFGKNALASYVGSFARAGANELLKGTAVGLLGEGANNYTSLIKTASALAGEGVGSLIDGEFSLNLLNLTDILNPFIEDKELLAKMDMGLFSMNFSKDENGNIKNTSRINSAGANVGGLVGLYQSALGMKEAYNNVRIGLSGADEKTTIALRGISSNGQEKSADLFEEILSGKTTLQEAFSQAVGEMAKTTATEYGKEIGINFEDLNGFELGVVLAHEAMRNGRKDGEEGQRQETLDAVLAHSDHAMQVLEKYGLGALGYQMVQEAIDYAKMQNGEISQEDFEAYVDGTYDSTEDYLKIIIHGDGRVELHDDNSEKVSIEDWRDRGWDPDKKEFSMKSWFRESLDEAHSEWSRSDLIGLFWLDVLFEHQVLDPVVDMDKSLELLEYWSHREWTEEESWNDWNVINIQENSDLYLTHIISGVKDLFETMPVPFQDGLFGNSNKTVFRETYGDYEPRDWLIDPAIYLSHVWANTFMGMINNSADAIDNTGQIAQGVDNVVEGFTGYDLTEWAVTMDQVPYLGMYIGTLLRVGPSYVKALAWAKSTGYADEYYAGVAALDDVAIGWKVGDPITNLTSKGNVPKWTTVRQRFWKNEALLNSENYNSQNLLRMQKGLAPHRLNPVTGILESMELHHTPPMRDGGLFEFIKVWPDEHALIDTFRHTGN
jgi:hypothetical protein